MTYGMLLNSVHGWTARHIAQDLMMSNGKNEIASDYDIQKVQEAERAEQK